MNKQATTKNQINNNKTKEKPLGLWFHQQQGDSKYKITSDLKTKHLNTECCFHLWKFLQQQKVPFIHKNKAH